MPTNLYGPNDNFHLKNSHVIPALIRRFHEAKITNKPQVEVWGSGNQQREFLHVDDMADATVFIMNIDKKRLDKEINPMVSHVNVGTGVDVSIKNISKIIKEVVGFRGKVVFDTKMLDGTQRKLLDISKIENLGWKPAINLKDGLRQTYNWFLENSKELRE